MGNWTIDDDEGFEVEDTEDDEDEPDQASLARLEAMFRKESGRIRHSEDIDDLRETRDAYMDELADGQLPAAQQMRGQDLIDLIDARIAVLKSRRGW